MLLDSVPTDSNLIDQCKITKIITKTVHASGCEQDDSIHSKRVASDQQNQSIICCSVIYKHIQTEYTNLCIRQSDVDQN